MWEIKLAVSGAICPPLVQEIPIQIEYLDAMIGCVSNVDLLRADYYAIWVSYVGLPRVRISMMMKADSEGR